MVFFHKRYNLPKEIDINSIHYDGWDEIEEVLRKDYDVLIARRVSMYDHSGVTIKIGSFSCPWDSGTIGFIVATRKDILKEFGLKKISPQALEKANKILEGEVETYDQYLTGDVHCFHIDEPVEEACGGIFGYENAVKEVQSIIDHYHTPEAEVKRDALALDEMEKQLIG